jgi:hypothetical protein
MQVSDVQCPLALLNQITNPFLTDKIGASLTRTIEHKPWMRWSKEGMKDGKVVEYNLKHYRRMNKWG